ncbi:MAG: hypothetical protein NTZ50_05430 [Chloroflexi bacterium]|nr:hypothetical protein [Chloroflexota bacterium]
MLSEPPQCRYPLGLLTSTEARVKPHAAANFVSSYPELAHTQAFDDAPDYTAPTSLGLNVRLRRSVAALDVEVYWGDYEQEAGDCYRRIPRSAMLCIPIPAPGVPIDVPDSGGLQLTVRMRGEFVDVFLINRRAAQPNAPQRSCAFQVTLVLRCAEGFAPHAPHASQPNTFAIGHGIAPAQQLDADGVCREVRSDWTPTAPLESAPPTALGELSMDVLGALADGAAAAAALAPLAVLAGDDAQRVEEGALAAAARQRKASATWHPFQLTFLLLTLRGLCDPAHVDRERADLFFRLDDDERLNAHLGPAAFAMVLRRLRKPGRDGGGVSVLLRAARHALTPDLLSRATGIICALELERARAPQQMGEWPFEIGLWVEHTSASVRIGRAGEKHIDAEHSAYARMMRFKQDDQRNPAPIPLQACPWCGTKFSRGSFSMWPNDRDPLEMRVRCANPNCDFGGEHSLPVHTVDESIHRRLPAFLIADADKFAALPWAGELGALFGHVDAWDAHGYYGPAQTGAVRPRDCVQLHDVLPGPDLILQEGLEHLCGVFGSMFGAYEAVVDTLATRMVKGQRVRPKIIAGAAEAFPAKEFMRGLFDRRETTSFPPPLNRPHEASHAQTHIYIAAATVQQAEAIRARLPQQNDGLIVTVLNMQNLRERRRCERFLCACETPPRTASFSPRALDRALPALLVALVRYSEPEMTPPQGAAQIAQATDAAECATLTLAQRAASSGADDEFVEAVLVRGRNLLQEWRRIVNDQQQTEAPLQYGTELAGGYPPLLREFSEIQIEGCTFRAERTLHIIEPVVEVEIRRVPQRVRRGIRGG